MNIQKLIIKNIASIEDAVIDFDQGKLANEPIFLITGDTGTGKTTILNAICLALYDAVPSLKTIGTSESDKEGLQTDNTGQLMRKGTGYSFVELSFTGNDGLGYQARWERRRAGKKPTGKLQNTVRQLLCFKENETIAYNGATKIAPVIDRVVGLSFEQFTRTTMLAQGQFANFMKAKDNEKSDILEKLTGTEIYARIGKKIYDLFKKKEEEYNVLDGVIKNTSRLSDAKKAEFAERLASLSQTIHETETILAESEKCLAWLQKESELSEMLNNKKIARDKADAIVKSDTNQSDIAAIREWDATVDIRRMLADEQALHRHIEKLIGDLSQLGDNQWPQIESGIKWIEKKISTLNDSIADLSKTVECGQIFSKIYENAPRIQEKSSSIKSYVELYNKHSREASIHALEAENSQKKESDLERAFQNARMVADEASEKERLCEDEYRKADAKSIAEKYGRICDCKDLLDDVIKNVDILNRLLFEHIKLFDTYRSLEDKVKKCTDDINHLEEKLPELRKEYCISEAFLQGQMELKDHIHSLRNIFSETGECPLCGTKNVHIHADSEIDELLENASRKKETARFVLEECESRLSANRTNRNVLKEHIEIEKKKMDICHEEIRTCIAKTIDINKKLDSEYIANTDWHLSIYVIAKDMESQLDIAEHDNNLESLIEETKAQLISESEKIGNVKEDLNQHLQNADKKRQDYESAHKTSLEAKNLCQEKERDLETQRIRTQHFRRDVVNAKNEAKETESIIKRILDELLELTRCESVEADVVFNDILSDELGIQKITSANVDKVAEFLCNAAKEYFKNVEILDKAKKEFKELSIQLDDCKANTKYIASIYQNNPAKDKEGKERKEVKECQGLEEKIRALNADMHRLEGEISGEKQKLEDCNEKITLWFENSTMSRCDVERICHGNDKDINLRRESVRIAAEALVCAEHEVSFVNDQIAAHNASKPDFEDGSSKESLTVVISEANKSKDETAYEKSRIETLLKEDEAKTTDIAKKEEELGKLREEKNGWATLNNLFGTSDGSRFKKVAQSYVLRALLNKANEYLRQLSTRYMLDCEDGSLTINVIDSQMGGSVRNVGLLSGGESFVVSLALALGLSAISKNKIHVDILFIDEGFGTLDRDYLDTVIDMLDRLHSIGDRRIGIISHVQELKERIPTQIVVRRVGNSRSVVEVTRI